MLASFTSGQVGSHPKPNRKPPIDSIYYGYALAGPERGRPAGPNRRSHRCGGPAQGVYGDGRGRLQARERGPRELRHCDQGDGLRTGGGDASGGSGGDGAEAAVDTAIAALEANHPNLTNQKMLYVEISRARDRAELVTDDKARLQEQIQALTGERIAALEAVAGDGGRTAELAKSREPGTESPRERKRVSERTVELERAPQPRPVDRDLGL